MYLKRIIKLREAPPCRRGASHWTTEKGRPLSTGKTFLLDDAAMHSSGIKLVVHKPFQLDQVLDLVREGMMVKDRLMAV